MMARSSFLFLSVLISYGVALTVVFSIEDLLRGNSRNVIKAMFKSFQIDKEQLYTIHGMLEYFPLLKGNVWNRIKLPPSFQDQLVIHSHDPRIHKTILDLTFLALNRGLVKRLCEAGVEYHGASPDEAVTLYDTDSWGLEDARKVLEASIKNCLDDSTDDAWVRTLRFESPDDIDWAFKLLEPHMSPVWLSGFMGQGRDPNYMLGVLDNYLVDEDRKATDRERLTKVMVASFAVHYREGRENSDKALNLVMKHWEKSMEDITDVKLVEELKCHEDFIKQRVISIDLGPLDELFIHSLMDLASILESRQLWNYTIRLIEDLIEFKSIKVERPRELVRGWVEKVPANFPLLLDILCSISMAEQYDRGLLSLIATKFSHYPQLHYRIGKVEGVKNWMKHYSPVTIWDAEELDEITSFDDFMGKIEEEMGLSLPWNLWIQDEWIGDILEDEARENIRLANDKQFDHVDFELIFTVWPYLLATGKKMKLKPLEDAWKRISLDEASHDMAEAIERIGSEWGTDEKTIAKVIEFLDKFGISESFGFSDILHLIGEDEEENDETSTHY